MDLFWVLKIDISDNSEKIIKLLLFYRKSINKKIDYQIFNAIILYLLSKKMFYKTIILS